ncbi:MAG: hypothetical protein GFH25_541218n34 [Chloroflexi bacterium AL-N10]|nr:hypothetical protein [Chloroflexi bacterium AL-N1]NOK69896.1 hypothetical protein [Chloroflexi bacterium AL-N10]NOK73807.1 hypothetical protein [Chloroflexi bacterium AL-N5]NOK91629.1 hypothetical protein [Chloroflexi bacterium AL-N15]
MTPRKVTLSLHTFGQQLRQYRKAHKLTQATLAHQAGCAVSTLRHIEHDRLRPSRQLAKRLAHCFNLDPDEQHRFVQAARHVSPSKENTRPVPLPPPPTIPVPLTPLIGRTAERAVIMDLLRHSTVPLLTLTGIGGVGKTHLALQIAHDVQTAFTDGVCVIDLVAVHNPQLLLPTLAQSLGVPQTHAHHICKQLQAYLRTKRLLLVLDNFEHLVTTATVLSDLLHAVPQLHMLVTSRVPLNIPEEHLITIEPLAVPSSATELTHDNIVQSPAVQLFVTQAQAIQRHFVLTPQNSAIVAAICTKVAGIPLALELAAAPLSVFSLEDILHYLEQPLRFLRHGPHNVPDHQRSLHATIAWSYHLLKPAEQLLFVRLAIFAGEWTLDAVEHICGGNRTMTEQCDDDHAIPPLEIAPIDGVAALLDSHLILSTTTVDGEVYFKMLVPIHHYAQERLQGHEAAVLAARHTAYYLALAEQAASELTGANQQVWLERLDVEYNNLRAALHWAIVQLHPEQALRLGKALWHYWYARSYLQEGCHWLEQIIALEAAPSAPTYAMVLNRYGILHSLQGNLVDSQNYLEQSLVIARQLNDQYTLASTLNSLGIITRYQGAYDDAIRYLEESLGLYRPDDNPLGKAYTLNNLGLVLQAQGQFASALEQYEASKLIHQELGNQLGVMKALSNTAIVAWLQGNHLQAHQLFSEALQLARDLKNTEGITSCLTHLGKVAISQQDVTTAQSYFLESLHLLQDLGELQLVIDYLEGVGGVFAMCDQPLIAAYLWGTEATLRTTIHSIRSPSETPFYEQLVAAARHQASSVDWEAAWATGQTLTIYDVMAMLPKLAALLRISDDQPAPDYNQFASLISANLHHQPITGITNIHHEL